MTGPLVIAFRKRTPRTLVSWLVHIFAGPPTHCVLYWPADGVAVHAVEGKGVEYCPLPTDPAEWDRFIARNVDAGAALARARDMIGAGYDYVSAVLFLLPFTHVARWTCSEFCAELLVLAGAPYALIHEGRTPRRLLRAVRALWG